MKKLFAGLLMAVLMSAGLVATSSAPAQADRYPKSVRTATFVSVPDSTVARGTAVRIRAAVRSSAQFAPIGQVTFRVIKNGKTVFFVKRQVSGGPVFALTQKFRSPGLYTVTANYVSPPKSRFRNSSDSTSFRVVNP